MMLDTYLVCRGILYNANHRFVLNKYEGHTESHEQRRIVGNSATSND